MREANNGPAVAEQILKTTDIDIDIIEGEEEAAIIAATDLHAYIKGDRSYLYVDVGGGSTEAGDLLHPEGGEGTDRAMAARVQHHPAPQFTGLSATSPRSGQAGSCVLESSGSPGSSPPEPGSFELTLSVEA